MKVEQVGNKQANTDAILYGMRRVKAAGYTPMYYSDKPYTLANVNYRAKSSKNFLTHYGLQLMVRICWK